MPFCRCGYCVKSRIHLIQHNRHTHDDEREREGGSGCGCAAPGPSAVVGPASIILYCSHDTEKAGSEAPAIRTNHRVLVHGNISHVFGCRFVYCL